MSLEQQLEREASPCEIAEVLDMSEEEVRITLSVSNRHVSTDSGFANNEDMNLMDVLFDPANPQPDNVLISDSLNTEIGRALSTLSKKESEILELFYGIGNSNTFSLEEIGERYGITRERVRQIKEKAIRRLRSGGKSKILKTYLG